MDSSVKRFLRNIKKCRLHYIFSALLMFMFVQLCINRKFINLGIFSYDAPKQLDFSSLELSYRPPTVSTAAGHNFSRPVALFVSHSQPHKLTINHKIRDNANYSVYNVVSRKLPMCPYYPKHLRGRLSIYRGIRSWSDIEQIFPQVAGGVWRPEHCDARESVAVIIPYRNRDVHLRVLVNHLHPILQRQELNYGIFVVEQIPGSLFNRASLFNIGVLESLKVFNYTCFIFHDVDLLPEDDRALYRCGSLPIHLSAAIDKFRYRLPYTDIFGGVSAISRDLFFHVNGFSNLYFGWGGEDDDMSARLRLHGFSIKRYPLEISRYKMIKHLKESTNKDNPHRFHLLKSAGERSLTDGVKSTIYNLVSAQPKSTVFWVKVDIPEERVKRLWSSVIPDHDNHVFLSLILVYIVLASIAGFCFTFYFCSS